MLLLSTLFLLLLLIGNILAVAVAVRAHDFVLGVAAHVVLAVSVIYYDDNTCCAMRRWRTLN